MQAPRESQAVDRVVDYTVGHAGILIPGPPGTYVHRQVRAEFKMRGPASVWLLRLALNSPLFDFPLLQDAWEFLPDPAIPNGRVQGAGRGARVNQPTGGSRSLWCTEG